MQRNIIKFTFEKMLSDKKLQTAEYFVLLFMITSLLLTKEAKAGRDRGARCEKPDYIPNGSYRIRRDRVMRINCNSGYILQGSKTIDCVLGKWDGEKPVCTKKGCKKHLEQPQNGRIQIENDVKAILYCSDNYNLAGNRYSYCNGSHWDRPIGNCREHKNIVQHGCDFETDDICGWTYEPRDGLEWKRVMAANVFTTFKTGPRHDHTTFSKNGGHYMLMESLTKQNDDVILTSPIYDKDLSLKTACCFQFYYFMYGAGVGNLSVVLKPVSLDLEEILKNHKEFEKYGNQNNIWNEAHFNIEELKEDFQILFVAKSGRGQLSDIAIDDVKVLTGDQCRALNGKDDEDLSKEDYDTTTYESIFEMQSCIGHCFDPPVSGIIRQFKHLKGLCSCDIDCEDNETCCPDFQAVCLNELFSQSTLVAETNEVATQKSESNKTNGTATQLPTAKVTSMTMPTTSTTTKTPKTTTTTFKMPPTTLRTTNTSTTPKPIRIKTTTRTTTRATTPTTTTTKRATTSTARVTTPTTTTTKRATTTNARVTTPTTTTTKRTTTSTARVTTPTTTTTKRATTPTARVPTPTTTTTTTKRTTTPTTRVTTPTTKRTTVVSTTSTTATRKTSLQITEIVKTSTLTPMTTHVQALPANSSTVTTSTSRPRPTSKSIEYVIKNKSQTDTENKGSSSILLYTLFLIVVLVLLGATYKSFGDRAVAWYMIRFKHNSQGDEDSSSVTSSFNRPGKKPNETNGNSKATWRSKTKKSFNTKNIMKAPLLEDDVEDDDTGSPGANGNIALRNNIYTEL